MWSKKRGNPGSTIGRKLGPAPSRKLSREQANQVVAMYKSGLTQKQIGATFSVTDVTISNVLRGLTYTELAGRNELTTLLGRGTKQKRKSK
jgi:DNA invertase Pin-like site-specific DNA recombinase